MFRGIRGFFKKKSDREESPESSLPRRKNGCDITSGNVTRYGIFCTSVHALGRACACAERIRIIGVLFGAGAISKLPQVGP